MGESRTEDILQTILDGGSSETLPEPQSRVEELLTNLLDRGGGDGSGMDGVTYTPHVSSSGVISWTNNGGRTNPQSVDLVAAVLEALPSAVGVSF